MYALGILFYDTPIFMVTLLVQSRGWKGGVGAAQDIRKTIRVFLGDLFRIFLGYHSSLGPTKIPPVLRISSGISRGFLVTKNEFIMLKQLVLNTGTCECR